MQQNNNDNQRSTPKTKHMEKRLKYTTWLLAGTLVFAGCKKDKEEDPITPAPVNENEVITTMIITFHDTTGGTPDKVWKFRDADGDGGNAPVITVDTLLANKVYHGSLLLLNETANPIDTSSNEVLEENTIHQFFYQVTGANLTFHYADTDDNGHPIGLETLVNVGAASTGQTKVTLIHECQKGNPGVSDGDITNAGGSTDIEVNFSMAIH